MTSTDFEKSLFNSLLQLSNPETKEKVIRLTSGAKCIGVTVPNIRLVALNEKKKFNLTIDESFRLANEIFPEKCREEILAIIFIIASFPKKQLPSSCENIIFWTDYLDNWETCDQLASNIVSPIIAKNPEDFSLLKKLTLDEQLWKRRFALATAANCNHGKFFFPEQTLELCSMLLEEKEVMVIKALGWAIREVNDKDHEIVKSFIANNKDRISKKLFSELKDI